MILFAAQESYQSSVDTTTTTNSDSTTVDLEPKKTEIISKEDPIKKTNPFASLKAKFCSAHFAVNRSIGLLSEAGGKTKGTTEEMRRNSDQSIRAKDKGLKRERHSPKDLRKQKRDVSFSKSTSFLTEKKGGKGASNLRIRICKCSDSKCGKCLLLLSFKIKYFSFRPSNF